MTIYLIVYSIAKMTIFMSQKISIDHGTIEFTVSAITYYNLLAGGQSYTREQNNTQSALHHLLIDLLSTQYMYTVYEL